MINEQMHNYGSAQSAIRAIYAYGLERKAQIGEENVFDFSLGNPSIPSPAIVKECIKELAEKHPVDLHSYSMGHGFPEVREAIADYLRTSFDFPASASHVFVTSGAAGAIAPSLRAITHPGDEVIVIAPFFPEYKVWIEMAECKPVQVFADTQTFQPDIAAIEAAISSKTSAIIFNSPNNPTGVVYTQEKIQALADMLKKKQQELDQDIYIIADEPYRKIVYGANVPFVPEYYPNTIVCDSASKSLSLPGERIGYAYVSDTAPKAEDVYYAIVGAARGLGHVCATVLFQRLYAKCINEPVDVKEYKKNKDLLTGIMDKVGLHYVEPEGAFYLWVKSPLEDANEFCEMAKNYELLLVPSDSFGVPGWVRLGYCIDSQTIINSQLAFEKLMEEVN